MIVLFNKLVTSEDGCPAFMVGRKFLCVTCFEARSDAV